MTGGPPDPEGNSSLSYYCHAHPFVLSNLKFPLFSFLMDCSIKTGRGMQRKTVRQQFYIIIMYIICICGILCIANVIKNRKEQSR
jgi:Na+/melibiose symporter-like transporter